MNFEVRINALIDTGSPISLVKEKLISNCLVDQSDKSRKFCGINESKLNIIGITTVNILCDNIKRNGVKIRVAPNSTMLFSLIIGRDLLKKFKFCLSTKLQVENDTINNKILSIDIMESKEKVVHSLIINSEIEYSKQLEFKKMFEKEYIKPKRSKEPKVDAELLLQVKDIQPVYFFPRRLSYMKKEQVKKLLDELAKEVIRY